MKMRHPFQRPMHAECPSQSNSHRRVVADRAALPPHRPQERSGCAAENGARVADKREHLRAAGSRVSRRASERGRAGLRASRSLGKAVASDVQVTANVVEAVALSLLPPRLVAAVDYATQQVAECGQEKSKEDDVALCTFAEAKQHAQESEHEERCPAHPVTDEVIH